MRPLRELVLPAMALAVLAVLTASCNGPDVLPPLGADPTAGELRLHAARYCTRLEMCAPGQGPPDCLVKLTAKDDTAEGRRGSAMMWSAFAECMMMDCMSMTACFNAKALEMGREQAARAQPQPTSPSQPPQR